MQTFPLRIRSLGAARQPRHGSPSPLLDSLLPLLLSRDCLICININCSDAQWLDLCDGEGSTCHVHHPTHAACSDFPSFSSISLYSGSSSPCPGLTRGHLHCGKSARRLRRCLRALAAASRAPSPGHRAAPGRHSQALCCHSYRPCPREYLKSIRNTNIWIPDTSQPRPYLSCLALLLEPEPEDAPNNLGYLTYCA